MSSRIVKLVEKILQELEQRGYKVSRRCFIKGLSGVQHFFDIVIESSSGRRVALTVTDEKLGFEHVLSILATRIDANVNHIVISPEIEPGLDRLIREANVFVIGLRGITIAGHIDPNVAEELVVRKLIEEIVKFLESRKSPS